jgi:ribosomal protein S18 acetylase RimI-like enzyme
MTVAVAVGRAGVADADAIGQLLHDFDTEFDEPTPGPQAVAERVSTLLADGEITVLLAGAGPVGLAVLRFRPSLWKNTLDCYLEELYVVPDQRGRGIGRALMDPAIELAREEGAADMSLGTGEDDLAARSLYESLGFSNRESNGALNLLYELEL